MAWLHRSSTGLLLQENFSAAHGWTAGTGWSLIALPTMVQFGQTNTFTGPTPGSGSVNYMGKTGSSLFIDSDGSWYIFSYGGNLGDGNSGIFVDKSTDRGYTWNSLGSPDNFWSYSTGVNFASGGHAWPGWIEKRSGVYIMHRICALVDRTGGDPWLPGAPQYGDIWTNSTGNIMTGWVFQSREVYNTYNPLGPNGGVIPVCVFYDGVSTYYRYFQSYNNTSGSGYPYQWLETSTIDIGPWTLFTPLQVQSSQLYYPTQACEALHVHYNPVLELYVGLMNGLAPSGAGSGGNQNLVFISNSLTGWPSSTNYILQRMPEDASNAIGIPTHMTMPNGVLLQELGNVPFTYDGDGRATSPLYEEGRSILGSIMEPSVNAAHFSDMSGTRFTYSYPLANGNFVAEFVVYFYAPGTGADISFEYRSNGTNGYRLQVRDDTANPRLQLETLAGILIQNNTTGVSVTAGGVLHHIKVMANGTQHTAWLDGEEQINVTNGTYATGTQIAFSGISVEADVRNFHISQPSPITVKGISPVLNTNVRTFAGLPIAQMTATSGATGTYTPAHAPISRIESPYVMGEDAQTTDLMLWEGDVVTYYPGHLPPKLLRRRTPLFAR